MNWVSLFISKIRGKYSSDHWLAILYDSARSNMDPDGLEAVLNCSIAVVFLHVHTSDTMQPLDVSLFGPLKNYTNIFYQRESQDPRSIFWEER